MDWLSSPDYTHLTIWQNAETAASESTVKTTWSPAMLVTIDTWSFSTISTSPSTPTKTYPYDMLAITVASAFIIAFLGTCGNLFTIIALPMSRKLRNTATSFVVNLAVVEMIFCLTVLPMSGTQYLFLYLYDQPLLSEKSCIFFALFRYTLTQVELQTILGIALTRALAVSLPAFYKKINSPVVMGCYLAGIWLYSFLLKLPTAIGIFGHYTFNTWTMECDLGYDSASIKARFIAIIVEVAVPMFIIIFLYLYILIMVFRRCILSDRKFSNQFPNTKTQKVKLSSAQVAKSSRRRPKSPTTTSSSGGDSSRSSSTRSRELSSTSSLRSLRQLISQNNLKKSASQTTSNISQKMTRRRRDLRVARTIFIIFLMVIVCSFPVGYVHFVDSRVTQPRRFLVVHILYWVQYCLNLVVYVLMNRQYRDAYVECLARVLPSFERHKGFMFAWERPSMTPRPPNIANYSVKHRKSSDMSEHSHSLMEKEQIAMPVVHCQSPARLSTIPEAKTTSNEDSDEVFVNNSEVKQRRHSYQTSGEIYPFVQNPNLHKLKVVTKGAFLQEENV